MPLASWRDTKETLHRYCQVVGKLRLAASVRRNHWWNVPFHLTGRGTTTRPMGQVDGNPILCIDFDFVIPVICRPACSMRSISGLADRPAQECGASRLLLAAWSSAAGTPLRKQPTGGGYAAA
jgi:hypothetical protein